MSTFVESIPIHAKEQHAGLQWKLAANHPVFAFLLITFAWSWLFWLGAIPWKDMNPLLVLVLTPLGGYGPALAGILVLGLRRGITFQLKSRQVIVLAPASMLIFGLMAMEFWIGKSLGYGMVRADAVLSVPVVLAALAGSLLGGWIISCAFSPQPDVRDRMASLLPARAKLPWILFAVLFYPAMILATWGIGKALGMPVEAPDLGGRSSLEVLPLFLVSFGVTALARGGMEEPGWRGVMQPALQSRFSPLAGALLVSVAWSLWHLPLYLNGLYSEPLVDGMIGSGIFRLFLAVFLAWAYNRSGSLLAMVILHTTFNLALNVLPVWEPALMVLWLAITLGVVVKDKMWRRLES